MKPAPPIKQFRIDRPGRFRLASFDPGDTCGIDLDKDDAKAMLANDNKRLAELQQRLYADGHWGLLVVLQGMDASGKDGVVSHVMTGLNPQGCSVHSFKQPSEDELVHDFLWLAATRVPQRGHIGIFNRSHYEEVLVVRVRPELLARQKLSPSLTLPRKRGREGRGQNIWSERFDDIRGFEQHLARNGVAVLKFFLHVSREEQRQRLLARLDEPAKRWKFSMGDIADRALWDKYMAAYEDMVRATSRPQAPWYVVPADHKWFARLVVARAMIETLERLDLQFPKIAGAALEELQKVRAVLLAEGDHAAANKRPRKQKIKGRTRGRTAS